MVDLRLNRILSHQIINLNRIVLAETMHAADALLDGHGIPRQIIVEQDVSHVQIDSLSAGGGADEELRAVFCPDFFNRFQLVRKRATFDGDHFGLAIDLFEFFTQEFERFPVLGKDNKSLLGMTGANTVYGAQQGIEFPVPRAGDDLQKTPHLGDFIRDIRGSIDDVFIVVFALDRPFRGIILQLIFFADSLPRLRDLGIQIDLPG